MKKKIHQVLLAFTLLLITSTLISQNTPNSNENSNFVLYPSGGTISKARIAHVVANASSHVNRSISSTNHAPVANNDTVYLCRNSTITIHVQNNDSDPDGDALSTNIYATMGNGTFVLNGTSINYTPHSGYIGTDTVIYYVCDGGTPSLCDTAIAFIHVVPSYTTNLAVSICAGDSAFIAGAFHTVGGVFTNTLTAIGGCDSIIVTSLTINSKPIPVITPDGPTTFCQGDSVHLSVNANTSYLWSTGATTQSISVHTSGNYYVTVTNASGCSATSATTTVSVIPSLTITPSSTSICAGGSTTLTATGALSYTWSPAASLNTNTGNVVIATPTTSTNYTVLGASGLCAASATVGVTVNPLPVISITPPAPTICAGNSATLTASGALTYTWAPSTDLSTTTGSVVVATPTTTATYTVSGSDANCTGTQTAVVTVTPLPVITISPSSATICAGNSTTLTASGASTYSWSPATGLSSTIGSTVAANPASDQTYTITGTSGLCAATQTAQVTVAPNPTITITPSSTLICIGNSATLTAGGADTYTWTPVSSLSTSTGSVVTATPTTSTTYSVTGTLGICPASQSILITVLTPPTPTITAGGPTTFCQGDSVLLSSSVGDSYLWSTGATTQTITAHSSGDYTVTVFNTCGNGSTSFSVTVNPLPIVTITPSGPTTFCQGDSVILTSSAASSYVWSTTATTQSITAQSSGTYSVKVTDVNGCSASSATLSVVVNPLPVISITPSSTTICAGNSATLTASGALTYTWAPSTDLSTTTGSVVVATPTTTATYTVSGSDANCTGTQTAVVTVTPLPVITISPSSATICAGNSTTLTASGASTYSWSPATGLSSTIGSTVAANPASDQTYTITGTSGLCAATQTAQVTVAPNPTITITPSSTLICIGNSATLTAGGADTYTWTPVSSLSTSTGSVVTATPTTSTTYSVTGTLGICPASQSILITVLTPPTPTITAGGPTTFCQGDSVLLSSSVGDSYLWSTGATTQTITAHSSGDYTVTVFNTCGNGSTSFSVTVNPLPIVTITPSGPTTFCQGDSVILTSSAASSYVWSTTATTQSITAQSSGTYSVKVTDVNGCSASSATLSVVVNPLPVISITPSSTTICAGNSATLTASGALTYTWAPSTDLSTTTGSVVVATPTTTATYTVSGSDANCTGTQTAVVTVTPLPVITISPSSATICAGNSTTLTASGASTYSWSPATGLSSTIGSTVAANPASDQTYTITGTSGLCAATQTAQVTVAPNPTITITPSSTLICIGNSATLTAGGADTYTWTPVSSLSTSTGSVVVGTPTITTTYSVTGTLGICPSTQTVSITVIIPPTPTITAGGPTTFCQGDSVLLTSSVGTTYLWSTGATTQTISVNAPGNYSVTTTNVNGCFATSTTTSVTVNPLPTASITPSGPTTFCQGDSVTLNANNGLSWVWSTGETTQSIKVNTSGTYTVLVTNICGSIASSPVTVTVNSLPSTTVTLSGSTTFCQGDSVKLTASAGSHYVWSNGDTTQTITVDSSGNYSVIVTNSFGCQATSSTTSVTVNPLAVAAFTTGEVKASMTYSFTNTSTNAVSYAWNFGDGQTSTAVNPTNVYAVGGIYNVTLIATNGCGPDTLTEILAVVSNSEFYNGFSPNGDGHNDFWNIPTLNDNTTNTVKVLNRWGSEVWQGVNYDNVSVVWKGQNMSGEDLPDGTYYYIITYSNVDKRGWVIIKR